MMEAAVFEGEGRLEIKKVPVPAIDPISDEVLIEVEGVSICGTDASIVRVPPAFVIEPGIILGHELVGHIRAVGDMVKNLADGDRVVVNPNDYCGKCHYCRSNKPNLCEDLKAMGVGIDGAFARYVKTSEKVCYRISDSVPLEAAVLAEPLACVINGTGKVKAQPGESAVIMGAGPIGLLFLMMFKASGVSEIIVYEPQEFRRDFAAKMGADMAIDPFDGEPGRIAGKVNGRGPDIVVDAVGSLMAQGIDIIGRGGRFLIIGGKTDAVTSFKQIEIVIGELNIMGTFLANASFGPAVRILESGSIPAEKLVTHSLPLGKIHQGIRLLEEGRAVKVLIRP